MKKELEAKKAIAIETAQEAGSFLCRIRKNLQVEEKGHGNWVTNADRQSERLITELIKSEFPDDYICGEEGGGVSKEILVNIERYWIIDPLDGTSNYVRGFDQFAVSIAYWENGTPLLGVVFAPAKKELFVAEKGGGAYLNQEKIYVSDTKPLPDSLVGTGIPYEPDHWGNNNIDHITNFLPLVHSFRCMGAAALDLASVAIGRLDGFWEYGLAPWDVAAGNLLVQEAGGMVTDFQGRPVDLFAGRIVASNGLIHPEMLKILSLGKTGLN